MGNGENILRLSLESSTIPNMESKQKKVNAPLIIGILLIVIVVFFGFEIWQKYGSSTTSTESEKEIFVPPPPVSPVNWKTYRNESLNFSIQYPEGTEIEEGYLSSPMDAPPDKNFPYAHFSTPPSPSGYYWNLSINVTKLENDAAAKTRYENQYQSQGEECEEIILSGDIKTVKCQSKSDNDRFYPIHYFFSSKNFGYDIHSGYEVMEKNAYVLGKIAAHDLMLKSFKILHR